MSIHSASLVVSALDLRGMFQSIRHALPKEGAFSDRLSGVLLGGHGDRIFMAATDGHRARYVEEVCRGAGKFFQPCGKLQGCEDGGGVFLRVADVEEAFSEDRRQLEIMRVEEKESMTHRVQLWAGRAGVPEERVHLRARRSPPPPFWDLVHKPPEARDCKVSRVELLEALEVFCPDEADRENHNDDMHPLWSESGVNLQRETLDALRVYMSKGLASVSAVVKAEGPPAPAVRLNKWYLLDALKSFHGGTVTLRLPVADTAPVHIRDPADPSNGVEIIMPMRADK